jgi:hypothetical protein
VLDGVRHPAQQILVVFLIACTDVLLDMFQELLAVSGQCFTCESTPQVVGVGDLLAGFEQHGVVVVGHWVLQPPLPER